jgi:hypothetical protein
MTAAVRAAWQNIVASFADRRINYLRRAQVLVVFTKVDLLFRPSDLADGDMLLQAIELSKIDLDLAQHWLEEQFSDLLSYMNLETRHFNSVATSALAISGESRVGISQFLHGVLPAGAFSRSVAASSRAIRGL